MHDDWSQFVTLASCLDGDDNFSGHVYGIIKFYVLILAIVREPQELRHQNLDRKKFDVVKTEKVENVEKCI